jgi:hypothetical protein
VGEEAFVPGILEAPERVSLSRHGFLWLHSSSLSLVLFRLETINHRRSPCKGLLSERYLIPQIFQEFPIILAYFPGVCLA